MSIRLKHAVFFAGLGALTLSSMAFSQTTLFNSGSQQSATTNGGGRNTAQAPLAPPRFQERVNTLYQQVQNRLQQQVAKILPPSGEGSTKGTQPAPSQAPASRQAPTQRSTPSNRDDSGGGSYAPRFDSQPQNGGGGFNFGY